MDKPKPDDRIAGYIAEISVPGIPCISRSHETLHRLCLRHGTDVVYSLIQDYFNEFAAWSKAK